MERCQLKYGNDWDYKTYSFRYFKVLHVFLVSVHADIMNNSYTLLVYLVTHLLWIQDKLV